MASNFTPIPPDKTSNLTPIPPDKIGECHAWREWLSRIYMLLTSTAPGTVPVNHNALTGLQGGTAGEEYHLTNAQQLSLLGGGDTTLHYHSSDRNLANATGTLATTNGGTGLTTIGANGQVLESNGTNLIWQNTVNSFNTRTGAVTLSSSDVTTALTYTPYNSTNPAGYITSAGTATNFSGSLSGDVTGTQSATVVGKINGISLAALATGILKNTTATGVPSIAVASDFPVLNQNTTGNAATSSTTSALSSSTTIINVSAASAPTAGQVLTATSGTAATWQTFTSSGISLAMARQVTSLRS